MSKINFWLNQPIGVGDVIRIDNVKFIVLSFNGYNLVICKEDNNDRIHTTIDKIKYEKHPDDFEGVNPFISNDLNFSNRTIDGLMMLSGFSITDLEMIKNNFNGVLINECNHNPYFVIDGEKFEYQRPLVWTLEQKQNFINSIYLNIDLGRFIFREHIYTTVEKFMKMGFSDFSFIDIVDGKQRINTIIEFISDKFKDSNNNLFSELSTISKRKFRGTVTHTAILNDVTDITVCNVFINNAVGGTPIDNDHVEKIKMLAKRMF